MENSQMEERERGVKPLRLVRDNDADKLNTMHHKIIDVDRGNTDKDFEDDMVIFETGDDARAKITGDVHNASHGKVQNLRKPRSAKSQNVAQI